MNSDFSNLLNCPKCAELSTTFLIKVAGPTMIIKMRCPNHGGRAFKVPYSQKDNIIPYLGATISQCYKCGQPTTLDHVKVKGPWTLVKCACPTHQNKLPYLKIWSDVYNQITGMAGGAPQIAPPQIAPSQPTVSQPAQPDSILSDKISFCPECGSAVEGEEKFCGACGSKLE